MIYTIIAFITILIFMMFIYYLLFKQINNHKQEMIDNYISKMLKEESKQHTININTVQLNKTNNQEKTYDL